MRMQTLVAALAITTTPLLAHAAGITDYSSHKPPAIALPPAGGSYIDPVFGTKIIRVTDKATAGGANCMHAYSYWPAFNHDDTRLLLLCGAQPLLYKFDPATDTLTRDRALNTSGAPRLQFEGATWSYSSPDILFAVDSKGTRLWKVDVSQPGLAGYTLLKDFSAQIPSSAYISQLSTDVDGHVFSFHTRDRTTDAHLKAMVWDRTTGKTYVFPNKSGYVLDESEVDKNGAYAYVVNTNRTAALWDFRDGGISWFSGYSANDDVGGHYDLGADFMVNSDMYHPGVVGRTYTDLRPPVSLVKYLRSDGSENWTLCDHVSLRALNEEFFVGSTYAGDGSYAPFEKEIYLGYLDGHGFVRLAHTRSLGNVSYWSQPRASVDMKGRYIVYTSDLGTSRTDVLIVKIPSQYWP